MAIRYVKDFEFPSAAGFTSSAPSKVTGPMFAKGGKVEADKAPKGMMVIIGVGKPKGPMKKAVGGLAAQAGKMPGDEEYTGYGDNIRTPNPRVTDWEDPMWTENAAKDVGRRLKGRSNPRAANPRASGEGSKSDDQSVAYKQGGKVKKFDDGGMYGDGAVSDVERTMSPTQPMQQRQPMQPLPLTPEQKRRMMMMQASKRQAEIAKQAQNQGMMSDMDARMMERGYKKGGDVESVSVKDIKSGKVKQSTDEDFYGKAKDMPMPTRRPDGMKKGGMAQKVQMAKSNAIESSLKGQKKTGYAEGGMKAEQGVPLPSPDKESFEVYDRQSGDVVGTYGSLKRASRAVDRRDNDYGGSRYSHRPVSKAKGGEVHDDAAEDKKMIKSMIKPSALKKADGGGIPPQMRAALAKRANSVPVAPRAPMIPQQAMPARGALASIGEGGIGVGQSRPNKPNVGALRAAMAKKASMAMPENAPSMMKKGGKVMC